MTSSLTRRVVAEFFGLAFLVATVVGSGVMAERLANSAVSLTTKQTIPVLLPRLK
jgi:glycerol uptake facilitator-like aquaporin